MFELNFHEIDSGVNNCRLPEAIFQTYFSIVVTIKNGGGDKFTPSNLKVFNTTSKLSLIYVKKIIFSISIFFSLKSIPIDIITEP